MRVEELVAKLKKETGKGTTDLLLDLPEQDNERRERDFERRLREAEAADRRFRDSFEGRPSSIRGRSIR